MNRNFFLSLASVSIALWTAQAYSEVSSKTGPKSWRCPPDQTCTAQGILCPPAVAAGPPIHEWKEINEDRRQLPSDPHTIRCSAYCRCQPPAGVPISCGGLGMLGNQTCENAINGSNSKIVLEPTYEYSECCTFGLWGNAEGTCSRWVRDNFPASICEQVCNDNLNFTRTCYTSVPNPNWMNEGGCDGPQNSAATPYCETNIAPE